MPKNKSKAHEVHVKIFGKKGAKEPEKKETFKHGSHFHASSLGYQQNDHIFQVQNQKLTIISHSEIKILESSSFVIVRKDGILPIKCIVTFLTEPQDTYDLTILPNATLGEFISDLSLLQDNTNVNGTRVRGTENVLVLADWIENEDELEMTITYNDDPPLQYKIFSMSYYMDSASEYAKNPKEAKIILRNKGRLICDHRDGDNGDDVTLYYPGFQRFIDQCNDITLIPTREEYTLIQHMCTYMSKYMPVGRTQERNRKTTNVQPETIRQDIFIKLMNQFLKNPIETNDDEVKKFYKINGTQLFPNGTQHFPNGMMKKGGGYSLDGYIDPCTCVILEVKNESGKGGESDSYAQAIAYYVKTLEDRPVDKYPAPAFLLELVGPHLFISGAVYGKYVFVDRLVDPVWLVPQNQKAMIRIARIFKALKDAIRVISRYYTVLPQIHKPRYPTVTLQIMDDEKAEIDITYTERIQANMFEGNRDGDPQKPVIVHFVENYNRDVHNLMHKNGLAPEILIYAKVKDTRYMAIITECIDDGATSFADYLKTNPTKIQKETIFKECEKALATMHREGLCHGNFTHESILIQQQQQDKKIFVVNFQFSGKFREERHGMVITPEGDDASLQQIKELLEIQ